MKLKFLYLYLFVVGCNSSSDFTGTGQVSGNVTLPINGLSSSIESPVVNTTVQLDQLDGIASVDIATTDAAGAFSFDAPRTKFSVLSATHLGAQFCSLLQIASDAVLDSITAPSTLACKAATTAIAEGTLNRGHFDKERIANLENASTEYLTFNVVNFLDSAETAAAVSAIRLLTLEGESPRLSLTPNCKNGEFACSDGTKICAEYICNEIKNCPDDSDERAGLCKKEKECCEGAAGCPQETSENCTDECCCCSLGEVCNSTAPDNGCVSAETSRGVDEDNPLSKIYKRQSYYN